MNTRRRPSSIRTIALFGFMIPGLALGADSSLRTAVHATFEDQTPGAQPAVELPSPGKPGRSVTSLEVHKNAVITVENRPEFGGKALLFDDHITDRTGISHVNTSALFGLAHAVTQRVTVRFRFMFLKDPRNSFVVLQGLSRAVAFQLMIRADGKILILNRQGAADILHPEPLPTGRPGDIAVDLNLRERTWTLSVNGVPLSGAMAPDAADNFSSLRISAAHGGTVQFAVDDLVIEAPADEFRADSIARGETRWNDAAGQLSLNTDALFPAPAARWTFSSTNFALTAIAPGTTGTNLLRRPGGVFLRDGDTGEILASRNETVTPKPGSIEVAQDFGDGLASVTDVISGRGALRWRIALTNTSTRERRVELQLALPCNVTTNTFYFDGFATHPANAPDLWRTQLEQTFPVSFVYPEGGPGIAFGVPPDAVTSILQNGLTDDVARYLTRLVVPPGHPVEFEFILYPAESRFGSRDALQVYYRLFPEAFRPYPGTDPRMTDGKRADALQANHYHGGATGAETAVKIMTARGGIEWAYAISKRGGDLYGHPEFWTFDETAGIQTKMTNRFKASGDLLNFFDREAYHEGKQLMWERANYRANVALTHFMINFVEEGLAKKFDLVKCAYPDTDTVPAMRSTWGFEYCSRLYHVYPWANAYEDFMKRDIPLLVKELNLPGMAHDMFNEGPTAPLYRGPLDRYMPGWSYDAKGNCLSRLLAYRKIPELCHSLTNADGHAVGVFANGIAIVTALSFAYPDCWLTETRPTKQLFEDVGDKGNWGRANYIHARLFAGSKPVYQHAGLGSDLGDVVDWANMTPREIVTLLDDFYKDEVTWYYQAGVLPATVYISTVESIRREIPWICDVLSRGIQPAAAISGDPAVEHARYGEGLRSAVVLSSRAASPATFHETIHSAYLGISGYAVPLQLKEQPQTFQMADGVTVFDVPMDPLENRIVTLNVALDLPEGVSVSGESRTRVTPTGREYRITLRTPRDLDATLAVAADPGFSVARTDCNGDTPREDVIRLHAGENTVTIRTVSTDYLSPVDEFTAFPFDSAPIVLVGSDSKRKTAAAQNLRDWIEIRRGSAPMEMNTRPESGPAVLIGTAADLGRAGVWIEGETLVISGENDFDAQQRAWFFTRFLERFDPRFTPPLSGYVGGGTRETKEMLRKADLLGKPFPRLDRAGQDRQPWTEHLRSDLKSRPVTDDMYRAAVTVPQIPLPRLSGAVTLDGKLDEAVWKEAGSLSPFSLRAAREEDPKPTQKTEVRYFLTDTAIVIGFVCHEANMERTFAQMTERDSAVWNDDCVEIRLAPNVERTAMRYPYHAFLYNMNGVCFDMRADSDSGDQDEWKKWNGHSECVVSRGPDFWSAEIRIPLSDLPGAKDATSWRFQFSRTEKPGGEYSLAVAMPGARTVSEPLFFGAFDVKDRPENERSTSNAHAP